MKKNHPWDDPDADAADDAVAGLGFGYERLDPIQGPHAKPSGPGLHRDLESTKVRRDAFFDGAILRPQAI